MTVEGSKRRDVFRRYPALGFLVVAGVLAVALPSALTVPNAGPPTLAEFAPVPGQGHGAGGDVSRLGSGSSGGLGFGPGTGPPDGGVPDPGQPTADLKNCVGDPPRQTEDPLSPPCVAFFEGENFGATARGVTGDEIVAVVHWGTRSDGNGGQGFEDYAEPITGEERTDDMFGKVFMRYFNARYQTYGRRLHLYGYYGASVAGQGPTAQRARADVITIEKEKDPFALLALDSLTAGFVGVEAAERGMVSATRRGFLRETYRTVAPHLISFEPDLEDTAAMGTSYLCRRLNGLPARYSGNATDRLRDRKFAVMYTDAPEDPTDRQLAKLVIAEAERRCGVEIMDVAVTGTGRETWEKYPTVMAQMRQAEVTTVIPFTKGGDPIFYQQAAARLSWFPEWFFIRLSGAAQGVDDTNSARVSYAPEEWRNAFGISHDRRRGRLSEQLWYQAFLEACPGCVVPNSLSGPRLYETLTMLFYGIQAAGPRLTAENMDRGLHAIPPRDSTSPYVPAHYFAPGNYSFVKDAKEMWWDGSGQPPGLDQPGCYRLPREGRRTRFAWPKGDDGLFDPSGAPCQGSAQT